MGIAVAAGCGAKGLQSLFVTGLIAEYDALYVAEVRAHVFQLFGDRLIVCCTEPDEVMFLLGKGILWLAGNGTGKGLLPAW